MIRRSGGSDIKERKLLLETAMTNSTCTQPVDKAISKDDPNYGRPQQGTFTEARGQRAQIHVHKEMLELCEIIYMNGEEQEDGTTGILFGDLFRIYTRISDKVVGLLLRARKYRLLYFEPEMLFQAMSSPHIVIQKKPRPAHYGTPVAGSKTEARGKAAHQRLSLEVLELCLIIQDYGVKDPNTGLASIKFGRLFDIYTNISDKVVGVLLRARKHSLLTFQGEILFQRQDDHVDITLLKSVDEIRTIIGPVVSEAKEDFEWGKCISRS
ncbi:hypothetical protein TCAL_03936 [Tigriopus californicus]|uniref:Costars domain-containing protein n=2 Tax=Tigriopus californicus TaxID=6832 RepID=A0A553P2M2_TIGCA|nr:hypothetical protein TCAL_03936 [Tigriopus californicus]